MEVLGHSSISLTANTYSHPMPSLVQDATEKVVLYRSVLDPKLELDLWGCWLSNYRMGRRAPITNLRDSLYIRSFLEPSVGFERRPADYKRLDPDTFLTDSS